MSKIYRRQRQIYVFTGLVGVVAIVNVLFFFILYRPTRSEYFQLRDSIVRLQTEAEARQSRVNLREKTSSQLQTSDRARTDLFAKHFISHDVGFAAVLPELHGFFDKAGVKWTRVDTSKEAIPQYGLYSVKIRLPLQGGYSNIVHFIRELENAETFYIINSIDLRGTETPGSPASFMQAGTNAGINSVALSLNLETFFYQ